MNLDRDFDLLEAELWNDTSAKDLHYKMEVVRLNPNDLKKLRSKTVDKMHSAISLLETSEESDVHESVQQRLEDLMMRIRSIDTTPISGDPEVMRKTVLREYRRRKMAMVKVNSSTVAGASEFCTPWGVKGLDGSASDYDQSTEIVRSAMRGMKTKRRLVDGDEKNDDFNNFNNFDEFIESSPPVKKPLAKKQKSAAKSQDGSEHKRIGGVQPPLPPQKKARKLMTKPKKATPNASKSPAAAGAYYYGMMPTRSVIKAPSSELEEGLEYIPVDDTMPEESMCYWCAARLYEEDNFTCECKCCKCGETRDICSTQGKCNGFFVDPKFADTFSNKTVGDFRMEMRQFLKPGLHLTQKQFLEMMKLHDDYIHGSVISKKKPRNGLLHPFKLACPIDSCMFEKGDGNNGFCNPCRTHTLIREGRQQITNK